jgi:hypothetical protein
LLDGFVDLIVLGDLLSRDPASVRRRVSAGQLAGRAVNLTGSKGKWVSLVWSIDRPGGLIRSEGSWAGLLQVKLDE